MQVFTVVLKNLPLWSVPKSSGCFKGQCLIEIPPSNKIKFCASFWFCWNSEGTTEAAQGNGPLSASVSDNYFGISCPSATLLERFVCFMILSHHSVEQLPLSCWMITQGWVFLPCVKVTNRNIQLTSHKYFFYKYWSSKMFAKCDLNVGGENSMQISSYTCVAPLFELLSPLPSNLHQDIVFVKDIDDQWLWLCLTKDARPLSYLRSSCHNEYILESSTWKECTELSGDFLSPLICKTKWLLKA